MGALTTRLWFSRAADGFLTVLDAVGPDDLARPALGVWDVRALLGHASRAFLTIEAYLDADAHHGYGLAGSADYFRAARASLGDPDAVADRGRDAGAALGEDPVGAFREIAERVRTRVGAAPDRAQVATPVGVLALLDYLPTRAFELTVHGLDLARALDAPVPQALVTASREALQLALDLAGADGAPDLLLALTGRQRLDEDFSVV